MGMELWCRDARDGRCSFAEFVKGTREIWRKVATDIMRKWRVPRWFEIEDIEQELFAGAHVALGKWDPTRGVKIDRYVIWNAVDKAKKQAHRVRGACLHGNADKAPSRYEIAVDFDNDAGIQPRVEATQERDVDRRAALRRALAKCTTKREAWAIGALGFEGTTAGAARRMHVDETIRVECGVLNEAHAIWLVEMAANAVAHRMRAMEARA